ncbi:hypothetical protein FRC07_013620 [Ceratobasidium sp. 392]|nr:hypothetical protein FRC07_013620 [Ceratobasidium sp. 392]
MPRLPSVNDDEDERPPELMPVDRNLPPIASGGFEDWISIFDRLAQRNDNNNNRDIFALTGHYFEGGNRYRAKLDVDPYKMGEDVDLNALCDIDSVLGIVLDDLPIEPQATFLYYMLADARFTLSTDLHLPTIQILNGEELETRAPLHHIPNCRFGEMGRLLIRIFFPALYEHRPRRDRASANFVGNNRLQLFYDLAVRIATTLVIAEGLRRQWPALFNDELFRAAPHRRQAGVRGRVNHQQTGREIDGESFNAWVREIRRLVDEDQRLSFAQGFFFLVEGKGLKNTNLSAHDPPDAPLANADGHLFDRHNPRTVAIKSVLPGLNTDGFRPGDWFIDLSTTVSGRYGHEDRPASLFVDSELHPEIINHFSGKSLPDCSAWVRAKGGPYQKDEVAHIQRFAGFRINFDHSPGAYGIRYLQVYTTDKSVTYHVDGLNRAKRTSAKAVLGNWEAERDQHFSPLAEAYHNAAESHPVAVRFESRVPFESYPFVHLGITWRTYQPWLFCVRNTHIWTFRDCRTLAYSSVLGRICGSIQARSDFSLCDIEAVGSLLILLVYMANALVNRPDEGGNWDEVHDAGCVHKLESGVLVPVRPLGIFYLHSLSLPKDTKSLPIIARNRTISRDTILYLCGSSPEERTPLAVLRLIQGDRKRVRNAEQIGDPWGVEEPPSDHEFQPHRPNKHRRVNLVLDEDVPDVFATVLPYRLGRSRYDTEDDDYEAREEPVKLSKEVTKIVYTFPRQIIAKAPNKQGRQGSWLNMDPYERTQVKFDLFTDSSAPSRYFPSFNNFGRDADRWNATVTALFPSLKEKEDMDKVQNLSQMSVWADWQTILLELSPKIAAMTVRETRKYVSDNWTWLPFYARKKLWVTGEPPSRNSCRQVGSPGGPWIVFNPKFRH